MKNIQKNMLKNQNDKEKINIKIIVFDSINKKKHKISFDEAETAFYDERARIIPDPDHS